MGGIATAGGHGSAHINRPAKKAPITRSILKVPNYVINSLSPEKRVRSLSLSLSNHRNLTDRLLFEGNLRTGLKTLMLQTLLFAFLILGSMISSNNPQAAGLRSEIVESFALDSISVSRSRCSC